MVLSKVKKTALSRMIPTEIRNFEYGVLFAQIALKLIVSYLCGEDRSLGFDSGSEKLLFSSKILIISGF